MNTSATRQNAIWRLLADPATHGGQTVARIDTHAASVFLTGSFAYKVKRDVKFPFLDFSTLAKRKAALEAEIVANKPFAPQLYLGLVPITSDNGKLTLDGKGDPVEWALRMRRFDETQTLDHLAEAGRIERELATALALAVAQAHERAPVVDAAPWISALRDYIDQNETDFAQHADIFPQIDAAPLIEATRAALDRVRPLLVKRGADGFVRRGHGDLHLGNIAMIDGAPIPFDALEFDPVMASGDILYDLAFLLMDLVERDLGPAANTVLNVYFAARRNDEDIDALAALPLFMSLRAAIRAKVTAAKLPQAAAEKHEAITASARAYFKLACRLIAPAPPRAVAVGGLSGTGKSVLARMLAPCLAPEPGALVLRSDVERKAMLGVVETDRLPEAAYTREVTARVYAVLAQKARRILAAGHSSIIDAVFARPQERTMVVEAMRGKPSEFRGLFLTADLATRIARVGGRVGDASDAGGAVARAQEAYDLGDLDWTKVDASGTPEDTLANALAALGKN
ncbi:MAG TPA: AAA family ATPase [Xanthobacteraceae bacterium]|nr:AAA family ATPase [Xanthobacteraceae bacterium]